VQVLYLIEAVDEYCIQSLPEFEGKKFQNAAKEGFKLDASEKAKERKEELEKEFEPLLKWMKEDALKDKVLRIHCYHMMTLHYSFASGKTVHIFCLVAHVVGSSCFQP